ncbi:MAG: diguanylate cyclase [Oscillospiraceae bacterium]|nr:diguanylate cyclase [Oscillospiraceae bacterium]
MISILNKSLCESCLEEISSEPCPKCGFIKAEYTPDSMILPCGSILQYRYAVGKVIGKGGFGITYLAYDTKLERKIAIKEYYPYELARRASGTASVTVSDGDTSETFQDGAEKFYNEARMVAKFNDNPSVVSIYDFFYENNTVYYSMEFLNGKPLKEHIKENGLLSAEEAILIAKNIASALMSAHSMNVLHRDVSPDNIMVCSDGKIKLIDFGAARQVIAEASQSLSVILKPGFAPLEQYQKKGRQGPWTDIYSLGMTLYYGLTGITPEDPMSRFEDDSEFESGMQSIPEELRKIIRKATMLQTRERYKDISEFTADLDSISEKDLSALKKQLESEHRGRITDELTGLKNRQGLNEYITDTISDRVNSGKPVNIVMCDIDHFKNVNDTYGHDAGDIVLKNVANILRGASDSGEDHTFRFGGEEMIVILNCEASQAYETAEQIRKEVERSVHTVITDGQKKDIRVTISMGVYQMNPDVKMTSENARDVFDSEFKNADTLLYTAKETGRNKVVAQVNKS